MRWLRFMLMLAVTIGLLVLTAWAVGTRPLLAGWEVLSPWTILAALGCGLAATAAQAVRWRLVLQQRGTNLTWTSALSDCYSSSLLNFILPGGLGGDLARVVVYRDTGAHRWFSPLMAVGAERLSVTTLLFSVATLILAQSAGSLALVTGIIAVVSLVICVYAMRGVSVKMSLTIWLTAAVSMVSLLALYVVVMLVLDGPIVLGLAVVGLVSMSIPIGVGGWGIREILAGGVAGTLATTPDWAVTTATGYGLLATISVLPGLVTLVWRVIARRRAGETGPEQNAPLQRD